VVPDDPVDELDEELEDPVDPDGEPEELDDELEPEEEFVPVVPESVVPDEVPDDDPEFEELLDDPDEFVFDELAGLLPVWPHPAIARVNAATTAIQIVLAGEITGRPKRLSGRLLPQATGRKYRERTAAKNCPRGYRLLIEPLAGLRMCSGLPFGRAREFGSPPSWEPPQALEPASPWPA
jgi:hypothetical protein